uniref:Uncharacterized protein n=1 Tax=Macaca fascicularis TaxID=9541 RepID=Q8HXC9_MACFA|nr:hypothetical protein [Macaca fascicularis]
MPSSLFFRTFTSPFFLSKVLLPAPYPCILSSSPQMTQDSLPLSINKQHSILPCYGTLPLPILLLTPLYFSPFSIVPAEILYIYLLLIICLFKHNTGFISKDVCLCYYCSINNLRTQPGI